MRKNLHLLFGLLLVGTFSLTAQKTVPYSSSLGSKDGIDPEWTFEAEAPTWYHNYWYYGGIQLYNSATEASSAWFISPEITLEANTTYTVSFNARTYAYSTSLNDLYVYVGTGATANEMYDSGDIKYEKTDINIPGNDGETQTFTMTTTEAGNFHFAFRVENEKSYNYFYLKDFSIEKANVVKPANITNLQVVPDAEGALSATLSWTLPTTDTDGADLSLAFSSVTVSRDDEVIAELEGNIETFTDTEETELTAGTHTYSVYATLENGESTQPASVTSDYIGTIEPKTIPYEEDFSDASEYATFWSTIDANNDNITWAYSSGEVKFGPNNTVAGDDWLLSPEINFEAAGAYDLSFTTKGGSRGHLKAFLVSDKDNLGEAEELLDCATLSSSSTYQAKSFEVSTPGIYRLGFHAYSEQGYSNQCSIDNISLVGNTSGVAATSLSNRKIRYDRAASRIVFDDAVLAGTVSVYDTTGRLVIRQSTDKGYVDAASLRPGIYIVCVNGADGISTIKIIK